MFIAPTAFPLDSPFGGAEQNMSFPASFASGPPNGVGEVCPFGYKHYTPDGVLPPLIIKNHIGKARSGR